MVCCSLLPYLYEILEIYDVYDDDGMGLRRLAMDIVLTIMDLAGQDCVQVVSTIESRLLPYLQLLLHQCEDDVVRWGAIKVSCV